MAKEDTPTERLLERIKRLVDTPLTFADAHIPFSEINLRFSDLAPPFGEVLRGRTTRERALPILRAWLRAHRAELADLFKHPEGYPALVAWPAICNFARDSEHAEAIWRFVGTRVFRAVSRRMRWDDEKLRSRLGHLPEDVSQELATEFLDTILDDVRDVENILAYLRGAARTRFLNLLEKASAKKRPRLETVEPEDVERQALRAGVEFSDVEALAVEEVSALIDVPRLVEGLAPREREFVKLILQGLSISEAARRMGIQPTSVSRLKARIARKLRPHLGPER